MKTIAVPGFVDRKKLRSKFFYISNIFKSADGDIKYIECKPFSNKKADKVIIFSNSVKIYKNRVPIDEVKNIATYSNSELISIIEDRIMKTINFSEETILKAVGSIKCYGYINGFVKGYNKRGQLIDKLIERGYVNDKVQLTRDGEKYLQSNFLLFDSLAKNDSHFK